MDVTKVICKIFVGLNFKIGVGALFGNFQNGYPFLVLASRG